MLADDMEKLAPAVAEARKLASMPLGKHKLVIAANPWTTLLNDQQETARSAALLRLYAWDRGTEWRNEGSLLACRACVNAGRSLGDEPIAISQLVRVARRGRPGLPRRTLALGEASDGDLAEVQKLLRVEDAHPTTWVVTHGERAINHAMYDAIETGKIPASEVLDGGGPGIQGQLDWVKDWFTRSSVNVPRQHMLTLEMLTELVVAAANQPSHEFMDAERDVERQVNSLPQQDVYVKMTLPPLTRLVHAFRRVKGGYPPWTCCSPPSATD